MAGLGSGLMAASPGGPADPVGRIALGPDSRKDQPSDALDLMFLNTDGFDGDLDAHHFGDQDL